MTETFSPIKLSYKVKSLTLDLELSSINFGINHVTVGNKTPFTSEWKFTLRVLKQSPENDKNKYNDNKKFESFLLGAFKESFKLQFINLLDSQAKQDNSSTELLAFSDKQQDDNLSETWQVLLKFVTRLNDNQEKDDGNVVYYPKIIKTDVKIGEENGLEEFNNMLKLGHEVLVTTSSSPDSTVGKAAEEVTESIEKLADSIANSLKGPFKTKLQRSGGDITSDVALWALIRKSTDELSFGKYVEYMEKIFCGQDEKNGVPNPNIRNLYDRRRSPFMQIDSYQAVKIATEAFLMVNCGVKKSFDESDIADITENVRIINGDINQKDLQEYYDLKYKQQVEFEDKNGKKITIETLPYLKVISEKLGASGLKTTSFDDALRIFSRIDDKSGPIGNCYGLIREKLSEPCFLELIWSYWHEESMMVQGLNAICRRFQNIRSSRGPEPLVNLQIDPLRPLNNLLWGYIQDHQHRLTVRRRAYEYNQSYNLSLAGNATKDMRYADPRSKFIEAFHTLLKITSSFYIKADDVTVVPDGFPVLNGLRETHLILSEGAGNQYGDLPSTARAEMLMEQWLLARPEFREFLPSRTMVAYPEAWMGPVSTLNQLLGFTNTSVLHFNYLAIYGEKILLSIRFGNWADPAISPNAAANWAHFWRKEIQGYIHAYRAVTGVDLSADNGPQQIDATQPSIHLMRRLREQKQNSSSQRNMREINI